MKNSVDKTIKIGGWGSENALEADPPNREIDFDFDFDSIVRAGEAKLRERVRGSAPSTLGLQT